MSDLDFSKIQLSAFDNAHATVPRKTPVTLAQFLDHIEQGKSDKVIAEARSLYAQYKAGDINKATYQAFKEKHLQAVTIAGTFSPKRQAKHLQQHSGMVIGDIDDLDDAETVRLRLQGDPYIVFVFISPSGDGLKVGVHVPIQYDATRHTEAWQAFADYIGARYGVMLDPSGKDVNRLCYVSSDPHLYCNHDAIPLPMAQGDRPKKRYSTNQKPGDAINAQADRAWWQELLERHGWTYSHDHTGDADVSYWTRPGKDDGISASLGYQPDTGNEQLWLYVWTDNAPPLAPGWHHPFSAYAILEHGGDFKAAAAELRGKGFTDPEELPKTLRVTQLSTVKPERVDFLWKPYLPIGRPVALEGDPGVGKSSLVAKIIAHVTTGRAFPNVIENAPPPSDFMPRNVCLLTSEDDPADTIRPRIEANDGNPHRVYLIDGWEQPDGEQGIVTLRDLALIKRAIDEYQPALIVFDPLQSFFGRSVDMNKANDTRPVLDAVSLLCRQHDCTPLYVRHVGKMRREAIHAGLGSIDIIANMRSALFLGEDPDNPNRRIIGHSKSNNAACGQSLAYIVKTSIFDIVTDNGEIIKVEAPQVLWDGLSRLTADDLSSPPIIDEEEKPALDQAREFLKDLLETPVLYTKVQEAAKQSGISWATIKRAKPLVGVKARRRQETGKKLLECPYEWYIPDTLDIGISSNGTSEMSHQGHQEQVIENRGDINSPLVSHMRHQETPTDVQEKQSLSIGVSGVSSEIYQGIEPPKNGNTTRRHCDVCNEETLWHVSGTNPDEIACTQCNRNEPAGVPF